MRNKYLILTQIVISFCFLATVTINAGPGKLDPTFSGDGKLADWAGYANDVVIQPNGKIVVIGSDADGGAFAVARYNPDGSPDTDFGGGDGKVTTDIGFSDEGANAVALQSDGKIVVVGTTWDSTPGNQWGHFALVRHNADGSLDPTFGGDGIIVTDNLGTGWVGANAVAIQADGKIVTAGKYDYFLSDFPEMIIIRYNPDGSIDATFGGGDGRATIDWGNGPFGGMAPQVENVTSVAILPDGKILAAGYSYGWWDFAALVRLNSNGSLDGAFGSGLGVVFTDAGPREDVPHSFAIQSDGKIVTAGFSYNGSNYDVTLIRYTSDGVVDTSFDSDGRVVTSIGPGNDEARAVVVQPDGKIVSAGFGHRSTGIDSDFTLLRWNPDGSSDTNFGSDGMAFTDFDNSEDVANAMVLDKQGRAIVVGSSNNRFAIARFLLAPDVSISGRVMTSGGQGLRNAVVTLINSLGSRRSVTSSTLGYFQFDNVTPGQTYGIGVSSRRYRFETREIQVTDAMTIVDITGIE